MPITANFVVKEHEEYGSLGLAMVGRHWAEPFGGMAVAHDMLEHFPRDKGTTEEELMALGASLLVRDGGNYFAQKGARETDPAVHVSSDMVQQCYYRHQAGDGNYLRHPGRTTRIADDWTEECIQRVWTETRRLLSAEFDDDAGMYAWTEDRERFIGWLRRGYRKAARRFRGVHGGTLVYTFMAIEKAADDFVGYSSEGHTCRITADVQRGKVVLTDTTDDNY